MAVAGPGSGSPQVMVEIRQLGGAYARPGLHPNAFAHRSAGYSLLTVGMAFDPAVEPHAALLAAALADYDTGGIWPNFGPAHDAGTARRAYGEQTLARLRAVAATYDPDGVLSVGDFTRT
jgi:FAD/FMN-containing dehydrogenase